MTYQSEPVCSIPLRIDPEIATSAMVTGVIKALDSAANHFFFTRTLSTTVTKIGFLAGRTRSDE